MDETKQNEKSQKTNNNWRERKAPNGIEALPKKETRSNTVFIESHHMSLLLAGLGF